MAQAQQGDTVKVHYTGSLEDGTVFDSSLEHEPLKFKLGDGTLIPGFEQAVVGMAPGESKTETIPAAQAFGPHREELVLEIDREMIPANLNPQVGQQLQMQGKDEQTTQVLVTKVSEAKVELDANHPLAGKDLVFDIQLIEIV